MDMTTYWGRLGEYDVASQAGATYLVLGGCDGATACGGFQTGMYALTTYASSGIAVFDLDDADVKMTGESSGDYSGIDVSDAGDINHDGFADFLVAASKDDTAGTDAGAIYILLGDVMSTRSIHVRDIRVVA